MKPHRQIHDKSTIYGEGFKISVTADIITKISMQNISKCNLSYLLIEPDALLVKLWAFEYYAENSGSRPVAVFFSISTSSFVSGLYC